MAWLKQSIAGKKVWPALILLVVLLNCIPAEGEAPGILKLGVRGDSPPFSYHDVTTDAYSGYSVDLCLEIARNAQAFLHYQSYAFVPVTAQNRFKKLNEKEIDILCEATTVTQERMRRFGSTMYTFISGASLMSSPMITNAPETHVGVLKGTTTEHAVRSILARQTDIDKGRLKNFKIIEVDTHQNGLEAFKKQAINLYLADREILLALSGLARKDNQQLIVSKNYYTIEPYALFIRNDDHQLRYIANLTLSEVFKKDIHRIFEKNFPGTRMHESLRQLFRLQQLLRGTDPLSN